MGWPSGWQWRGLSKLPSIWGIWGSGILLIVGLGCAGRVLKSPPEEPLFGPGVMKLSEAQQSEGRPTQPIRAEIADAEVLSQATPPKNLLRAGAAESQKAERYYVLRAEQCQALAAAHAVWGNILDEESELAAALVGLGRTQRARSAALQSDLLRYAALAERNRAAADALELFYRLAEAEAHWDLCQAALQFIDKGYQDHLPSASSEVDSSTSSGSTSAGEVTQTPKASHSDQAIRADSESWQHRRRWQKRLKELGQQIEYLNSQLRPILGGQLGDCRRIWPLVSLQVQPEPLDVEKAVQQGLDQRAELRALRRLLREIDANDLRAVRQALEQWHPGLGATPSRFPAIAQWLGTAPQHIEAAVREEQIRFLLARREKEVEEQIRQKARQVEVALAEIAQAQQAYRASEQSRGPKALAAPPPKVGDAKQEPSPGQMAAQLAFYEAQVALLSRVVAWKIAEVRLKEAMGILARQTGYPLPEDAWQGMPL